MNRFVVFAFVSLACWATLVAAQHHVKILTDSRYLSNNGQFGSAYSQADGVDFKEETDAAGNRRGSYSYLDPNGQKRTVSYTAGKDGFRATGDHLPVAPEAAPVAAAAVTPSPPSPWQNQWSQPPAVQNDWNQWNSAPAAQNNWNQWNSAPAAKAKAEDGEWVPDNEASKYDDGSYRAEYEDPNYDQKNGGGQPNQWNAGSSDDNGQWSQWNTVHASTEAPKHNQWNQWNSIPTTAKWNSQWTSAPTPAPYHGNQVSGKISLNRSPDGYSYSYTQN